MKTGNQISVREVLPCHKLGLINWMPCRTSFEFMCQTGGSRQASHPTMVKTCLCLKPTGDVRILSNLTAKNVTHLQKRSIWLPAPNSDNILSLFQFCAKFSNSTRFSPNILFTLWKDVNQYHCQNASFRRKFAPGKGDCIKKCFYGIITTCIKKNKERKKVDSDVCIFILRNLKFKRKLSKSGFISMCPPETNIIYIRL